MNTRDDGAPLQLPPRWIEAQTPPADMPLELEPRAMRQSVPAGVLGLLLFIALGLVGAAVFALWSAYNVPIGGTTSAMPANTIVAGGVTIPMPEGPPPEVAPNTNIEVAPEQAREINEKIPFFPEQLVVASPFKLATTGMDRERAITCLASAAYYEAGNDRIGMAAVVQVVLNRVRHPAFPNSICGVVFQGVERHTGCQFTFACDGALARVPVPAVWERARSAAMLGVTGFVFRPVGQATHYHTDWVVPKWSPQLVKIAQIHTHLFFRWPNAWGGPGAFRQVYAGSEMIDPSIVGLMAPLEPGAETTVTDDPNATAPAASSVTSNTPPVTVAAADLAGSSVKGYDRDQASFIIQLAPTDFPGNYALLAFKMCKDRTPCRVSGWRDPTKMPRDNNITDQARNSASFLYERLGPGNEKARWNCRETPRTDPAQCIAGTN